MTDLQNDSPNIDKGTAAKVIYFFYLAGPFIWILPPIGLVIAYVKSETEINWLKSHYQFQIRTFWYGLCFLPALIVAGILQTALTFIVPIFAVIINLLFALISVAVLAAAFVFWYVRTLKGLAKVYRTKEISNPNTWLFGD